MSDIKIIDNERVRIENATINIDGIPVRGAVLVNKNKDAEFFKYTTNPRLFTGTVQELDNFPTLTSDKSNNYNWRFVEQRSAENLLTQIKRTNPTAFPGGQSELQKAFYNDRNVVKELNDIRRKGFSDPNGFNSPQLAQTLPGGSNAAPSGTNPQPQPPEEGGNPPVKPASTDGPVSLPAPIPESKDQAKPVSPGDPLTYPIKMRGDQDRIKFTAVEYRPSGNLTTGQLSLPNRKSTIKESKGSVFLPVQASITDTNSVDWQGAGLNVIERGLASLSGGVMTAKTKEELEAALGKGANTAMNLLQNSQGEIRAYLAGEAVGIQNLLGRFGSVLNPNLELLFTGPQLRPFEFRFQMTAREEPEAKVIKQIINYFKRNMAVRTTDDGVFLRAPNTFFIEYQKGGSKHQSINQIKECALTNCSVDYTPLGTYMTFNDTEATMVSYAMTLSFQELEPIYADDYNDNHPIGY